MRRHDELRAKRLKKLQEQKTPAQIKATKLANLEKGHAAKKLKIAERQAVVKKVEAGEPITEPERELLHWKGGAISKANQQHLVIAAAGKLLIKPQSITELRCLVEKTAAKHSYNPIEELIMLTKDRDIPEKEKIAIHKALLPFLAPQLAAPKATKEGDEGGGGVRVNVTHFVFPEASIRPLYQEAPAMVDIQPNLPDES